MQQQSDNTKANDTASPFENTKKTHIRGLALVGRGGESDEMHNCLTKKCQDKSAAIGLTSLRAIVHIRDAVYSYAIHDSLPVNVS
jgi:hypothetical protein